MGVAQGNETMSLYRPAPPPGYKVCNEAPMAPEPVEIVQTGGPFQSQDPDWIYYTYSEYKAVQGAVYYKLTRNDGGDEFWLYPHHVHCGGCSEVQGRSIDLNRQVISQIQQALSAAGYVITVSGMVSSSMAAALYAHQKHMGINDVHIYPETMTNLGLPEYYAKLLGTSLQRWYTGPRQGSIPKRLR